MREIKFRGKSLNTGEWVKGYYLVNRGRHYIAPDEFVNPLAKPSDYEVDPDTIGQYTGAKDSKGKEIYEGDILVLVPDGCIKHIVSWNKQEAAFNVVSWGIHRARIIGNIHDDPELLEL